MQKMIAQSNMSYGTRRLRAGDSFEVHDDRHATALEAVGKARSVGVRHPKVPPHDAVTMLRAEYQRRFGKRPFMGWDEAELRQKLAASGSGVSA